MSTQPEIVNWPEASRRDNSEETRQERLEQIHRRLDSDFNDFKRNKIRIGGLGTKNNPYDVIVVGGGISGLYCCYHLTKDNPPKKDAGKENVADSEQPRDSKRRPLKIAVFESSDHFGGRIETWKWDGSSLLRAEDIQDIECLISHSKIEQDIPLARQIYDFIRTASLNDDSGNPVDIKSYLDIISKLGKIKKRIDGSVLGVSNLEIEYARLNIVKQSINERLRQATSALVNKKIIKEKDYFVDGFLRDELNRLLCENRDVYSLYVEYDRKVSEIEKYRIKKKISKKYYSGDAVKNIEIDSEDSKKLTEDDIVDIWAKIRFPGVELIDATLAMLKMHGWRELELEGIMRLNRLILKDVLPKAIQRKNYEIYAEFGPMRIEPAGQPFLQKLLDDIGIVEGKGLVPFPHYTSDSSAASHYDLLAEEAVQKSALDLLMLAMRRIFELMEPIQWNAAAQSFFNLMISQQEVHRRYWKGHLQDWLRHLKDVDYDAIRRAGRLAGNEVASGPFLWEMGFWNLVSDVLSHEAVLMIRDSGSFYHLFPENPNAAEWLIFWLRGLQTSESLRGVEGGMSRIVTTLEEELEKREGVVLKKNEVLKKISSVKVKGETLITLFFNDDEVKDQEENKRKSVSYKHISDRKIYAKEVILALPKKPIENIKGLPENVESRLGDVFRFPLLKCFFIVNKPWWGDDREPNKFAANFSTRELHWGKTKDNTRGWVMIYTDRPGAQFWSDYLKSSESEGELSDTQERAAIWRKELGDNSVEWPVVWNETHKKRFIDKFVQYIRDNEDKTFTADRVVACGIRDWGRDPYGGACHAWRAGAKSWQTIDLFKAFSLKEGEPKNVHICGEAYSDYQGFIEGALRSAARVLCLDNPLDEQQGIANDQQEPKKKFNIQYKNLLGEEGLKKVRLSPSSF